MKRTYFLAASPVFLLVAQLFAGSAGAVVVSYDESGDGDLPNNVGVTDLTLDIGTNTVMGNASAVAGGGTGEFDDMILTVQAGQMLTSATFAWSGNTGVNVQTQFRLHDGMTIGDPVLSGNPVPGIETAILGTAPSVGSQGMFLLALPLTAGKYLLDQLSIGVFQNQAANFDYTWTFEVSAVPLPPAVWLFVSGLLAMAGLSRRKQAS